MTGSRTARHIQDFSSDSALEYHWGYVARQVPCTKDAGTCAYLDAVYHGHDISMLYSFILWAVIVGILFLWVVSRHFIQFTRTPSSPLKPSPQPALYRLNRTIRCLTRHRLLPETSPLLSWAFGHTTRLQILTFLILSTYLLVFTLVGITYKTWITPISGTTLHNTRSGLGPWSDRIGVLAFALTPLSILLSSRESLLSLITGIPYHHFNFLHRWLGYIIYVQSALHTLSWTIVEGRLYQPQPSSWTSFIAQPYIIWGIVAMILLSFLVFHSTKTAIRLTGYELFRKAHYIVAMVFVGACWAHWSHLYPWMIASLVVWFLDRGARLARTFTLHHLNTPSANMNTSSGFHVPKASIRVFANENDGDVVRLDFQHNHDEWQIGQHFFLCFPELSIWQAHPLTPASVPGTVPTGQPHTYIIRARKGLTRRLAEMGRAMATLAPTTSVVLAGPYGQSIMEEGWGSEDVNVLCVAGGTGITFVLPPLLQMMPMAGGKGGDRLVELVWVVRRQADMLWVAPELEVLRKVAATVPGFSIRVFVSRERGVRTEGKTCWGGGEEKVDEEDLLDKGLVVKYAEGSSEASSIDGAVKPEHGAHPDLDLQVSNFLSRVTHGPTRVLASGPAGMITTLRESVAANNKPGKVWRGEERWDVQLVHDDRVEW
ncbi:ferric-chelate reductase [Aspergillus ellipticus CBS 707.79]|uniref:Ferric-chelate reductase n=1 Tax=Aspergillus ellipticus CBS 707.79 TaxID=1448320 RepID=A0A319D2D6_9EURO|nr:ferric-chelate reductase [Aspergillus ellipticus CBS 707.79]